MSDPVYRPVEFPGKGLDLSGEAGAQSPLTTPLGENVRFVNPGTLRSRGGSRSGLSRWIDDLTAAADVQELNIVVSASPDAIGYGVPYDGGGGRGPRDRRDPREPCDFDPYGTCYDEIIITPPYDPSDDPVPDNPIKVPDGGDGHTPHDRYFYPPRAKDDSASCQTRGNSVTVSVLSNDQYLGTPSIQIVEGPFAVGAAAGVTGTGASSKITYTSKAGPGLYEDRVRYRLYGTRNAAFSEANVRVAVDTEGAASGGWVFARSSVYGDNESPPLGDPTSDDDISFGSVAQGQLVVLAAYVRCGSNDLGTPSAGYTIAVTDNLGNTYTQAETLFVAEDSNGPNDPTVGLQGWLFYTRLNGGSANLIINVQITADYPGENAVGNRHFITTYYTGAESSTPFVDSSATSGKTTASPETVGPGDVSGATGQLVVGAIFWDGSADTVTPAATFTEREDYDSASPFIRGSYADDVSADNATSNPQMTRTDATAARWYLAFGGRFRYAL